MRILLDHNTPAPLRYWLLGHQVETAYERGWAELSNGDLLRVAEDAGFEVLLTTDKGIRYQQNLRGRKLGLAVLSTNDWTRIRKWRSVVVERILEIKPGHFLEIEIPAD
jgi:hypothetical protein